MNACFYSILFRLRATCSIISNSETGHTLNLLLVLLLLQLPLPRLTYQALLPLFRTHDQALPFPSPLFDIACISQAWRPFNIICSTGIVQDFPGLTLSNLPSISSISSQKRSATAHDFASQPPKAAMK